jgi:hypothetical protein
VPWLRWLVSCLSPRRNGSVWDFFVNRVALGQFPPTSSALSCQYHYTADLHNHISCGAWTIGPL